MPGSRTGGDTTNHRRPATLVTGATRGIGRAIVERLAKKGHAIVGVARTKDVDFPGKLVYADLSDRDATTRALAEITADFQIDNLVNNAGFNRLQRLGEIDLDSFQRILDINLRAALQFAQAVAPRMAQRGYGRIVNIASRALLGRPGSSSYSAAKAGLVAMTRSWALELASHGVTVNTVAPGPTETEMWSRNNPPSSPETQAIISRIPTRRLGKPTEIAAAVEYFLSEDAGFTTGQLLFVCGGLSIGGMPS